MDDDALWAEIRRLETEEDDISLNRRVLHAQIDIVSAERAKRARAGEHVDAGDPGSIPDGGQRATSTARNAAFKVQRRP